MPERFRSPQTIAEYSDALRRRLTGILPPEQVDAAVAEAEAHLHDSADALRAEADLRERAAVARFVPVGRYAGGIARAWAPVTLRHRATRPLQNAALALGTAGVLGVGFLTAAGSTLWPGRFPLEVTVPVVAVVPAVFLCALAACRPQPRRMVAFGLTALAAAALLGGTRFAAITPTYFASRYEAPRHERAWRDGMARRSAEVALLRDGARFAASRTAPSPEHAWPASLRSPDGILLPRAWDAGNSAFRVGPLVRVGDAGAPLWRTHDTARALRVWRANAPLWISHHAVQQRYEQGVVQNLVALQAAPRARFDVDASRWLAGIVGGYAAAAGAADLAGGILGACLLTVRRRRDARRRTA